MELQDEIEAARKATIAAYKHVFKSDAGILVLEHLKKSTNFYRSHFCGKIDANILIAEEARRGLVLEIIANVEADFDNQEQKIAITEEP